jgi:hypothetical protein
LNSDGHGEVVVREDEVEVFVLRGTCRVSWKSTISRATSPTNAPSEVLSISRNDWNLSSGMKRERRCRSLALSILSTIDQWLSALLATVDSWAKASRLQISSTSSVGM